MSVTIQPAVAPQLENWNQARELAGELIDLFYHGKGQMRDIDETWEIELPPYPIISQQLLAVTGMRRWEKTDEIARWIMTWEN